MLSPLSAMKAYLKVYRSEYFLGELLALFIPLFLASTSWRVFTDVLILEGIAAFVLLYLSGFMINALADREMDSKYGSFKTSISRSVDYLGERLLKLSIITHLSLSLLFGAHISYAIRSPVPLLFISLEAFLAYGYSMRPFSFKTRGVLFHMLSLSLCCFFLPLIFLFYLATRTLTWDHVLFSAGFAMVHYAIEMGNQIQDYEEDRKEVQLTPPVRIGLKASVILAFSLLAAGVPLMIGVLYHWFGTRELVPILFRTAGHIPLLVFITLLLISGYLTALHGLIGIYGEIRGKEGSRVRMGRIRSHINYPVWQLSGVTGLFLLSLFLFILK